MTHRHRSCVYNLWSCVNNRCQSEGYNLSRFIKSGQNYFNTNNIRTETKGRLLKILKTSSENLLNYVTQGKIEYLVLRAIAVATKCHYRTLSSSSRSPEPGQGGSGSKTKLVTVTECNF